MGECWDLAEGALEAAGAKTSNDLNPQFKWGKEKRKKWDEDYIWGSEISFKELQPGDIIQFKGHVMTYRDKEYTRGHHTAIVEKVDQTSAVHVIEQHVTKNKSARRSILYFYDTIIEENGQQISIKVTGQFHFYRPLLKQDLSELLGI